MNCSRFALVLHPSFSILLSHLSVLAELVAALADRNSSESSSDAQLSPKLFVAVCIAVVVIISTGLREGNVGRKVKEVTEILCCMLTSAIMLHF